MTFTVLALSPDGEAVGVATATMSLAVGASVPAVAIGVGALATQAHTNSGFRARGLDLLAGGRAPAEVLDALRAQDEHFALRQVGVLSVTGETAAHTGERCTDFAAHRRCPGLIVLGNYLHGAEVLDAMQRHWAASADVPFADRLVGTLTAGQRAGGDRRGLSSAALLIASTSGTDRRPPETILDLRVDDHAEPVTELGRLLGLATRTHRTGWPDPASDGPSGPGTASITARTE